MKTWKAPTGDEGRLYLNTGELFSAKPPPILWAIPKLLPGIGLSLLAGKPNIGKSCLAVLMAVALATQASVLGYAPPAIPMRVLCVQADCEEYEWQRQVYDITKGVLGTAESIPLATLHMPPNWLTSGSLQKWVEEAVQTVNPHVIIWDSLNTTVATGINLNDHSGMSTTLNQLRKLAGPRAQLLTCHTNKDPEKTGIDKIAYSHVLTARARLHMILSVDDEDIDKQPKPGSLYVGGHIIAPTRLPIVQTGPVWSAAPKKPKPTPPTGQLSVGW